MIKRNPMLYDLLKNYFGNTLWYSPLAVDVITSGDYHLYLFDGGKLGWLVVVEADYPFVTDIPRDVETSFPVHVEGWCTLLSHQKQVGQLLPRNAFMNEQVNESDEDWLRYHATVHQEHGANYAVLRVKPNKGVSASDFGLTFYGSSTRQRP